MKKVGRQRVAVPEEERRAKDIAAVRHPEIRQIVTRCIVDDDAARATAAAIVKICHLLLLLHPTVPVPRPEAAEEATQDLEPVSLTQVFVKGLTGKTIMVEAQPTDTVRALKGKIAEVDGMPPVEKQRLVLGGRQLEDRFTLVDYNIEHESVLHLALRQTAEAAEPEPASEPEPQPELGEEELARREARKQAKKQRRAEEKAARAREAAAIAAAQARRNIELGYTPGGLHKDMSTSMGDSLMLGGNAGSGGDAQTAGLLETAQLPPARYQPPPPAARVPARAAAAGAESAERASGSSGVPATREVPLGLDPAAFLPKHAPSAGASREEEARLVASLLQQGPTQASCLQSRLASLRVLRRYWAAGDVKAMVGQLAYLDDLSLLVDLLHAGAVLHPSLDLEGALLLLPLLVRLAASQFEHHQLAALDALQSLLASFGAVIAGTREAPRAVGVDLSREDRRRRCDDCHEHFVALQPHARRLASDGGRAQPAAAELLVAMRTQLGIGP